MNFKNNVMMKKAFGAAAAATMIFSTVAAPVFANETVIVAQDNAANDLNNSVSFSGTARLNGMDKVNTASLTHEFRISETVVMDLKEFKAALKAEIAKDGKNDLTLSGLDVNLNRTKVTTILTLPEGIKFDAKVARENSIVVAGSNAELESISLVNGAVECTMNYNVQALLEDAAKDEKASLVTLIDELPDAVDFNIDLAGLTFDTTKVKAGDKVDFNLSAMSDFDFSAKIKDSTDDYIVNTTVRTEAKLNGVNVEVSEAVTMFRLYNPNSGEHFYTADSNERAQLIVKGWNNENIGWYAPETSDKPVYRLYNENAGDHHYTMNGEEKDALVNLGWKYEGIGWYSADEETGKPLFRAYNPNAKAGSHNYTLDKTEQDHLVSLGWEDEGIAWYAVK
ncbi:hypothetical protein AAK899_08385 [Erysipelotrichaceae bacterium 51-3]